MTMLKRLARPLAAPAVFLLLALAATWPLAASPASRLPMGTESSATVPLFNVWTVWWNADRAATGYDGYWDAPIFHPQTGAFSFSEPMPLSVVAAPILWITGNRVLAYNTLLIVCLWLNGWVAYRLLRRFHFYRPIPWIGGAMVTLLPLIHSWLGVLQLVPVFGILWTVAALYRLSRRPTPVGGMVLGGAFSVTYLMCAYYGLFLLLPLMLSAVWLLGCRIRQWRMWRALLAALLVGGIICLPFAMRQGRITDGDRSAHTEQYLAQLSAMVPDYLVPPWPHWSGAADQTGTGGYAGFRLCPGYLKLGLASAGMVFGLLARRRRRWTLFCLSMLCVAFALSLGPLLQISGWQPYMLLVDHLPGFGQARNVFRFGVLVHLMAVLLAMMGVHGMLTLARRHICRDGLRRLAITVTIVTGLLAAVEVLPRAQPLYQAPDDAANRHWVNWLATRTPADSVIVCVPFPFRPDVAGYQQETQWMYWQTFHGRKMVNGYSGHFPRTFLDLKMPMAAFPAPESIHLLRGRGVNYCVVKRDSIFAEAAWRLAERGSDLEPVLHDDTALMDIYRLLPSS
ncbi:hypothetical protein [Desulfosarcina ovata]|nr:hypothetical protein [Desulfosarcina ovata]